VNLTLIVELKRPKDPNTDEADGKDETLVPLDYETAGQIVDDEIHDLLVKTLPKGVRLTAIMDCCRKSVTVCFSFSTKL
jgi:hypothetical protein